MKKILLFATLFMMVCGFSANAQMGDVIPNNYFFYTVDGYQLVKVENFLFNNALFSGEGEANANDSVPESMTEFTYGTGTFTMVTSMWEDGSWMEQMKMYSYFSSEEQLDSLVILTMDTVSQMYEPSFKFEEVYDNGVNTMSKTYQADSITGAWNLMMQDEYTFNNSGHLMMEESSIFIPDSADWYHSSRTEYVVDASGRVDSTKEYFWMPVMDVWQPSSVTEHMYNNDGMLESEITYTQDFMSPGWNPETKSEYTYNSEGNQVVQTDYMWDMTGESWVLESKDSIIYANGRRPLVEFYYDTPGGGGWFLTTKSNSQPQAELYLREKTFFTWQEVSAVEPEVADRDISVYPNPATDYINIRVKNPLNSSVRLFDMKGSLVYEKPLTSETTSLPVKNLIKGAYLVKVNSQNKINTQVILVK